MNQIALIFSDNIFITVADDRELLPNRCHDNDLITTFGVFTPYFSGCLLFPLNSSRRLGGHIVHNSVDGLDLVYDPARAYSENFVWYA